MVLAAICTYWFATNLAVDLSENWNDAPAKHIYAYNMLYLIILLSLKTRDQNAENFLKISEKTFPSESQKVFKNSKF